MKDTNWYFLLYKENNEDKFFEIVENALVYYEEILEIGKKDCKIKDDLETDIKSLPSLINYYFSCLQDIESIVNHIDLRYKITKNKRFQYYFEKYNRTLKSSDADKYAEADEETIKWLELKNIFLNLRNRYMGIIKSLDSKNYQLNNIVKLKTSGYL